MATTHPLARYLHRRKLTQAEFSRRSGVDQAVLSLVLNGRRARFSLAAALAIDLATGGEVSFARLTGVQLPRRGREASRTAA